MLIRSALLLFAAMTCALPAQAQDAAAFYPLHEGDVRLYKNTRHHLHSAGDAFLSTIEWAVGSDSTVNGNVFRIVDLTGRDPAGTVTFQERCLTRYVPALQQVVWRGRQSFCGGPWGDEVLLTAAPQTERVPVESDTLDMDVILSERETTTFAYARDIGLVRRQTPLTTWPPGVEYMDLVYARINGVEVGDRGFLAVWEEFAPMNWGDEWIYGYNDAQRPPGQYFERRRVIDRQEIDGVVHVQLLKETFRSTGTLLSSAVVDLHADRSRVCYADAAGACLDAFPDLRLPRRRAVRTVTIGGVTYPGQDAWHESYGQNMAFSRSHTRARYIGFVQISSSSSGSGGGTSFAFSLRYARVGGVEYGVYPNVLPVSDDEVPAGAGFHVALAGANPSAVTALDVTTTLPFTVTVYDALGRRLTVSEHAAVGASRVQVDLGPWSAGVYTAVVRTSRGEQASVRLIRP